MRPKTQQYKIRIHSASLASTSAELDRIRIKYIPIFKNKLNFDQKRIHDPTQDRLSQLTTKQIDRIVQMEKIKQWINDRKHNNRSYIVQKTNTKHLNVYKSNFIAKINRIALDRNIRQQRSEEFDQNQVSIMDKKNIKYSTNGFFQYRQQIESNKQRVKKQSQDNQVKSIESIEDNIDSFEQTIEEKKKIKQNRGKQKNQINQLKQQQWFEGMSEIFLPKEEKLLTQKRSRCIDIQYLTMNYCQHNKYQPIRFKTSS